MRCGRSWGKKQKRCDPSRRADRGKGDQWDHVVFDPQTKLLVSMVIGTRTEKNTERLWEDFVKRTNGVPPALVTTDEYPAYFRALLKVYGNRPKPRRRPFGLVPEQGAPRLPAGMVYAMVHKVREKGRVVDVKTRRVHGKRAELEAAIEDSPVSNTVNTSFIERNNATVRQHNSRKARKVYSFSKKLAEHVAMSWFANAYYNFCRPHRGLRRKVAARWSQRSPAVAAGIVDHVWGVLEFMRYPIPQTARPAR